MVVQQMVFGGQVLGRTLLELVAKKELETAEAKQAAEGKTGLNDMPDQSSSLKNRQGDVRAKRNPDSENSVRSQAA